MLTSFFPAARDCWQRKGATVLAHQEASSSREWSQMGPCRPQHGHLPPPNTKWTPNKGLTAAALCVLRHLRTCSLTARGCLAGHPSTRQQPRLNISHPFGSIWGALSLEATALDARGLGQHLAPIAGHGNISNYEPRSPGGCHLLPAITAQSIKGCCRAQSWLCNVGTRIPSVVARMSARPRSRLERPSGETQLWRASRKLPLARQCL